MTRIVGGVAGGRQLTVPQGRDTRPTSDRTREALFSTLESLHRTLSGKAFLDLYAGSGAVGLEAASRGAEPVLLVESARPAIAAIHANIAALGLDHVELRAERVDRLLAHAPTTPFDVVFVDPPYRDAVDDVLALLDGNAWLAPAATVVVERATKSDPPTWPAGWVEDRVRRYGDSTLWYGRRP